MDVQTEIWNYRLASLLKDMSIGFYNRMGCPRPQINNLDSEQQHASSSTSGIFMKLLIHNLCSVDIY